LPKRFELAQALWGSIEAEWESLPVTDSERKLLDESLEAYYRDPEAGTPWPEARAELLREL
jgi:putative addiction module component (TIGR02574 family)